VILIDTSEVIAALDPRQAFHSAAAQVLLVPQQRLLSPFILAEIDCLIARHGGQDEGLKFLRDVHRGVYRLEPFSPADMGAAIHIIERYADLQLGLADASIVVLAERYQCYDILTLDQRHFRALTGPHGRPFRLLPHDATSAD
jgi:predicted nucleic acid-binding protein